nr:MAG TPA: hypothetical protein [Caudoviricetes sp.]
MALTALIRGETAWFVWNRTAAAWQSVEKLRIELQRQSKAKKCPATAKHSEK